MKNKTHYDIIYETYKREEWVIASFMFWDEVMDYMKGKKKVLLKHYYERLSIR